MIQSFGHKLTEKVYNGDNNKQVQKHLPTELHPKAQRLMFQLDAMNDLSDIRQYPSAKLEKLQGDLQEYYSIRINDQWRLIFEWDGKHVNNLEIKDYH
ncbi:MAG: type II toxin-antitoxin system RelE/ParE family toxin [Candidatus Melainabacteria bacterium]|nr:type II toxin-antitoxin system RelE/ParE family toxin [Candidatus Melainabacteria bacterium]